MPGKTILLLNRGKIPLLTILILLSGSYFSICQNGQTRCVMGYSNLSFQDVNPVDATAAIAVYVENTRDMLQKKLNKDVDFSYKIFSSFEEMKKAIKENSVDLISLSTAEYYELKKDCKIYPYLTIKLTDDIYDQYCLIAHVNSEVKTIKDVLGKNLSIPVPKYHVLMEEWLNVALDNANLDEPKKTFKVIKTVNKESNAVYDVFFNHSDCAVVRKSVFNTICELNPQVKLMLKIIGSSKPIVLIISAANELSDQVLLKVYLEQALMSSNTANLGNILKIFKTRSFAKLTEENMKSAKEIVDKYNYLVSRRKIENKTK
jgi:ABC-type phosphate/phosphonate transport system substrate-binding protein